MAKKFLNSLKNKSKWFWAIIFTSLIIDYLNTYFYDTTQNYFFEILNGKDIKSVIYIFGISIIFIFVLIITGMMSSDDKKAKAIQQGLYKPAKKSFLTKTTDIFFGVILISFSIILFNPLISILGIAENNSIFSDNQQMWLMILSIVIIIIIAVFGMLNYKPRFVLGTSKYFIIYIPVIIAVSLFIDFSAAIWQYSLADESIIPDPNRSSKIIEFIALFPLFAIFFSAPRFILLRKSFTLLTLISYLVLLSTQS